MDVNFALSLSVDGICLLQRRDGSWVMQGQADVLSPTLTQDMAQLAADMAGAQADSRPLCRLIIPNDQIKYLTIDHVARTTAALHHALDGITPYSPSDLTIDSLVDENCTHIAAVATHTLQEAENFATAHGFSAVSFVAVPPPGPWQAEVFFGLTTGAADLIGPDTVITRDATPAQVTPTNPPPPVWVDAIPPQGAMPVKRPLAAIDPPAPPAPGIVSTTVADKAAPRRGLLFAAGLVGLMAVGLFLWLSNPSANMAATPSAQQTPPDLPIAATAITDLPPPVPARSGPRVRSATMALGPAPGTTGSGAISVPDWPGPVSKGSRAILSATSADLRLSPVDPPPLPPNPDRLAGAPTITGLISITKARVFHDITGIWLRAPRLAGLRAFEALPKVRAIKAATAVRPALPLDDSGQFRTDIPFDPPQNPPRLDARGLIVATAEGVLTPQGALVIAGLPDLPVTLRPDLTEEQSEQLRQQADIVPIIDGPPGVTPALRRDDSAPISAGGVGLAGLQGPDGNARYAPGTQSPGGVVIDLSDTAPNTDQTAQSATLAFADASRLAVAVSTRPAMRPASFAASAAAAAARREAAPAPAAVAAAPVVPRSTPPAPVGVARAATIEDAIPLRQINLIGVFGRSNDRRALVRLSNGRYQRVAVGSALDGGQVIAIGDRALNYVKRGRTYALELPSG